MSNAYRRLSDANLRYQETLAARLPHCSGKRRMQLPLFVRAVLIELSWSKFGRACRAQGTAAAPHTPQPTRAHTLAHRTPLPKTLQPTRARNVEIMAAATHTTAAHTTGAHTTTGVGRRHHITTGAAAASTTSRS